MKKIICILLSLSMLLSVCLLASCSKDEGGEEATTENTPKETEQKTSEITTVGSETTVTDESTAQSTETELSSETESEDQTTAETESETESETETEKETEIVSIEGEYAKSIMNAAYLRGDVQSYYTSSKRNEYFIENNHMTMTYKLTGDSIGMSALTTKSGKILLENTMDAYITMDDGRTYYASDSSAPARMNMFKYGYYYYDLHFLDQNFLGDIEIAEEYDLDESGFTLGNGIKSIRCRNGILSFTISGDDPFIYADTNLSMTQFDSSYKAVQFTMRATSSTSGEVLFIAGGVSGHSGEQCVGYQINGDGEWHTYTVYLADCPNYSGTIKGLRFDFSGGEMGETIAIKDIKAVKIANNAPNVAIDREFHTYSDKLNYVTTFVAKERTTGVSSVGTVTYIPKSKVDKIIIKDAIGLHDRIDYADMMSVEYVGFHIKDAGVVGFILPVHQNSGNLEVTLEGDNYCIKQVSVPRGNILKAVSGTLNNYSVGCRIYTDESDSFDSFVKEAELELHPFDGIESANYVKYDALRGVYTFSIGGTGFNEPFFNTWNKHYSTPITLIGGEEDRSIYVLTHTDHGSAEGACVLDENNMLLPIPTMIFKNFAGEMEEPVFYASDAGYGETLVPLVAEAGKTQSYTILNVYQNWGISPIKQLSSIQFFAPYYHLSTGVTETSCIAPWYVGSRDLWTLPDFRSMSAPFWFEYTDDRHDNQPQHTHGGYHYFLEYTDAEGNYYASENVNNYIESSGLNYSEVIMDYVSDDGKIEVSYNHIEMPQTDEHRAYYEIEYKVLDDISFTNFSKDFAFYTMSCYGGSYTKMGYLDVNGQCVATDAPKTSQVITLGKESPYVSLYGLQGTWENKCANIGVVIYNAEIIIGGEKYEGNFIVYVRNGNYSISLDIGEVTLKKGDTIKLNMILVPWGSEQSTDDSNMIKIRENSCINPLDVTVTSGEKMDSVFLPRVKSTDGKSAQFTLTGGNNNCVVRVYGFDTLTTPKIYEVVDGERVEYISNSSNNPDNTGASHTYDGYFVYYDFDGTYSYTFVVDMTDTDAREFVIICE